ncbi:MAG TPA: hypothetical protein RMH99_21780 [Sandaracinaceae bacterium LLY-WYZ-13_1]|nr:hypothetical protein [Sandaracinaceae bacterium LLY-WYZ-13_1]
MLDAAMANDGGIVDGAVPIDGEACPDLSGTWEVSFVNAETSCGGAAVGRASDLSLSGACTFTASSQEPGAPAIDGTLVVRADETFDPAATAVATGTAEPVSCTGMVDAADSAITLSCNACVMNLARP